MSQKWPRIKAGNGTPSHSSHLSKSTTIVVLQSRGAIYAGAVVDNGTHALLGTGARHP